MIEVRELTKYYGNVLAIKDVSFEVKKGEILGLLGPNAAGKTTTMRILTGFLPPSSGTAKVAGYDVLENSLEVRKRIGYLPENVPLYPEMTVKSYLEFVTKLRGVDRRMRNSRIKEIMGICRLAEAENTLIGQLSRGYKQRVGIAQALIHEPEVLILDEPTIGLDPKQIIETRQLIKSLGGERTIILSTHILPEVSMTCERVVIINEGRVIALDTPENLEARLRGSQRIHLVVRGSSEEVSSQIRGIPGVMALEKKGEVGDGRIAYEVECSLGSDIREDLARTIVNSGWGLLEMRPLGMSLEEIFLKLTTKEEEV